MDPNDDQWQGLTPAARAALQLRDYKKGSLGEQIAQTGVDAGSGAGVAGDSLPSSSPSRSDARVENVVPAPSPG